ncbi:hypothetical protein BGW42_006235 [Actinomortierella wolfii]|nr:hypothetical protein BGW42_006235 [Actinomortierella wolfii]
MNRPQLATVYFANCLSMVSSVAIIVVARWVIRAVPSHRARLWLVMATALSNFGFSIANLITDMADTATTLPCAVSAWCYIIRMRARSRAELRRFHRMSESTFASLGRSSNGSGSDDMLDAHRSSAWSFGHNVAQNSSHDINITPNTALHPTISTTTENTAHQPSGGRDALNNMSNSNGHPVDTSAATPPDHVQIEVPQVLTAAQHSPSLARLNRVEMVANLTQRREEESSFLFAILRQALYPISITASGCIQIFVDLTLNDETPKRSTFETAATVVTNLQGFLFFLVFLFDPAVAQWRRMWREYVVWKWYIEYYFSLGMPQEGKDFEDRFLANCQEHLDEDPTLARFLRPPAYAWSHSYQRYLAEHQSSRLAPILTFDTIHGEIGTTVPADPFNSHQPSEAVPATQGMPGGSNGANVYNPANNSQGSTAPSAETSPPNLVGTHLTKPRSTEPIDTSLLNTDTPDTSASLVTVSPKQPPPRPPSPPAPTGPSMLSPENTNSSNNSNRRSWLHCGAATAIHPLSGDDEGESVDQDTDLPIASKAAHVPFRAPIQPSNQASRSSRHPYFREYAQQLFRAVSSNALHSAHGNNATGTPPITDATSEERGRSGEPGSSHQSSQDMNEKHVVLQPTVVEHKIGSDDGIDDIDDDDDDADLDFLTDEEKLERRRRRRRRRSRNPSILERRATIGGGDISHAPYYDVPRAPRTSATTSDMPASVARSHEHHWWQIFVCCYAQEAEVVPTIQGRDSQSSQNSRGRGSSRTSHGSSLYTGRLGSCRRHLRISKRSDRRNTPELNIVYQRPFRWLPVSYCVHVLVRKLMVPKLARLPPIPYPKEQMLRSRQERQASVDLVVAGLWRPNL